MPLYVFDIQNHIFKYLNRSFPNILTDFKIKDQEHFLNLYLHSKQTFYLYLSTFSPQTWQQLALLIIKGLLQHTLQLCEYPCNWRDLTSAAAAFVTCNPERREECIIVSRSMGCDQIRSTGKSSQILLAAPLRRFQLSLSPPKQIELNETLLWSPKKVWPINNHEKDFSTCSFRSG